MENAVERSKLLSARTSHAWLAALRANGAEQREAMADLHALLLRAARFELRRRRGALNHVRGEELEDLAVQAADDAMVAVLAKLDGYRGASRFTTWAYKFALLEAASSCVGERGRGERSYSNRGCGRPSQIRVRRRMSSLSAGSC